MPTDFRFADYVFISAQRRLYSDIEERRFSLQYLHFKALGDFYLHEGMEVCMNEPKYTIMENLVRAEFFQNTGGGWAVSFKVEGTERIELAVCGSGELTLYVPRQFQDASVRLGLLLVASGELAVDFSRIQMISAPEHPDETPCTLLAFTKALFRLCEAVNLFFRQKAASYWAVPMEACYVKNGCVYTPSQRMPVAYHQLITIDAGLRMGNRVA